MFRQGSHDNPYRAAALDAVVHSSSQCEQEPKRQDGRQLQESSGIGGEVLKECWPA